MHAYHYRFFVGPTVVSQVSAMLRAAAMPWQHVTIEGTEHVHVSILALHSAVSSFCVATIPGNSQPIKRSKRS